MGDHPRSCQLAANTNCNTLKFTLASTVPRRECPTFWHKHTKRCVRKTAKKSPSQRPRGCTKHEEAVLARVALKQTQTRTQTHTHPREEEGNTLRKYQARRHCGRTIFCGGRQSARDLPAGRQTADLARVGRDTAVARSGAAKAKVTALGEEKGEEVDQGHHGNH